MAFDGWKCTDRHFRFGSVGEDSRICLWDFGLSSLRRKKTLSISRVKSYTAVPDDTVFHPTPSKKDVPMIEPVVVSTINQCKSIGNIPLTGVLFREDAIVTADKVGTVSVWSRPTSQ